METKRINYMRLEIDGISINEGFARGVVAAFAAQMDPSIDEINDIKTAVSEAVTNCVVHAYGGVQGIITIECELFADRIQVQIKDAGEGITDIESAMQPFVTTKPTEERSGMGFTVMQSFMDSVNVQSNPGSGTHVTMQKFFQSKTAKKKKQA